jgi:hypothetical protein
LISVWLNFKLKSQKNSDNKDDERNKINLNSSSNMDIKGILRRRALSYVSTGIVLGWAVLILYVLGLLIDKTDPFMMKLQFSLLKEYPILVTICYLFILLLIGLVNIWVDKVVENIAGR